MFALNSKTLVCAYGMGGSVESVFERLLYMCLSNYSKSYVYGAVLDLPSSVCYREMHDYEIEDKAKRYLDMLKKRVSGSFFCVIRQRRYKPQSEYLYCCEDGAMGALRAGARLVYLGVPECIYVIEATKLTEPLVIPMADKNGMLSAAAIEQIANLTPKMDAILIGPGLGCSEDTQKIVLWVLENCFLWLLVLVWTHLPYRFARAYVCKKQA